MLPTRKPFTPREYQVLGVDWLMNGPARSAMWASPGLGKTGMGLTAFDGLLATGQESRPALVLGPKRVAKRVWSTEAAKWEHLREIIVSPIIGTEAERVAALKRDASVYTINYDNLPWLVDHLGDSCPFGTLMPDESTRLKNSRTCVKTSKLGKHFLHHGGGVRAQALADIAWKIPRLWEFTGTPAPNGIEDLWGQMWFVDQGNRLGRTHGDFVMRWFMQHPSGYGVKPTPFAQAEIQTLLKDVVLSINAKDWFDLREPIVNVIKVELPPKARKLYRDMEKEMFAVIDGIGVEANGAASRTIKCLQIANGAAFTDPPDDYRDACDGARKWSVVHDAKLEALESLVTELAGVPLLVGYHFKPDRERLLKAFPKARDLADDDACEAFKRGEVPIGIGHPASIGHGIDGLQDATNHIAFFGNWWDAETHDQIVERIGPVRQIQAGLDRPVHIHYLVAEGTVDEDVIERVAKKRAAQEILKDAMRRFQRDAA